MSLTDRTAPRPAAYEAPDPERVRRVADALLDRSLEPIVDMVVTADGDGYKARAVDGRVRFRRGARATARDGDGGWRFDEVEVEGRNPLGDTATDRFSPLADELDHPWPDRTQQSYPHAHEQIAQLFDHPAAPDVVCLHTSAHNWEDQGGERGEHGSLGVVQARAPFVLAGRRRARHGLVPRVVPAGRRRPHRAGRCWAPSPAPGRAASASTVGRRPTPCCARQDGEVLDELLDPATPGPTTWSASCGTAPTPTSCTTWSPPARRRTWPACWRWAPALGPRGDGVAAVGHAGQPHDDPHRRPPRPPRHPPQRLVRPGRRRAGRSPTRRPRGRGRCRRCRPRSRPSTRPCTAPGPAPFTVSVNEPCDTGADSVDLRAAAPAAMPPAAQGRGPAVRHRAVRAAREEVPGRRRASTTPGMVQAARRVGRRLPGAADGTRCPGSRS